MFNLIIFGPPGSGKGTQSVKVAEKYQLKHISTGDILRSEVSQETELGLNVKHIMTTGELVPDELLFQILLNVLETNTDVKGFIFDGFPRTLAQAKELDKQLEARNSGITKVLSLDVPDDEVVDRLLKRAEIQGRKDDNRKTIGNRLNVYKTQTTPLLDFYKKHDKLNKIHGVGGIEDIFNSICQVVG